MTGRKGVEIHRWSEQEKRRLAEVASGRSHADIRRIMESEFGDHFGGKRIAAALKRYGIKTGLTGRFEKGNEPQNKGKTWDEYMSEEKQAKCRRTQFKRGEVNGRAAAIMKPVGAERVNCDGYVEVKVSAGLQDSPNSNYRLKHRVVYEQFHGSVPDGCNVVFADGDRSNFDTGNLVAVPRDLMCVLNHRHIAYHDAESLEAALNVARLDRARFKAECRPRECATCKGTFVPRYAHQRTCDACLEVRKKM